MSARHPRTPVVPLAAMLVGAATVAALLALLRCATGPACDTEAARAASIVTALWFAPIGAVAGFVAGAGTLLLGVTMLSGLEWGLGTAIGTAVGLVVGVSVRSGGPLPWWMLLALDTGLSALSAVVGIAAWIASGLTGRLLGMQAPTPAFRPPVLAGYFLAFALVAVLAATPLTWLLFSM